MIKIIFIILALLIYSQVEAVKEFATEFPSGTPLEVYTPNNSPTLNDLANVDTSGVATDDTLIFNGSTWEVGAGGSVSDEAYSVSWDTITTIAPSKNAVYDVISGLGGGHDAVTLDANANTILSLSTQALGLDTQTANYVWAGPTSGVAAVPTFRAMAVADISDASANGRSLISAATYSTMRGLLDLEAGTDFPALGGAIPTGVWDFGGATSVEIPNAANPTLATTGMIAINTTDKTLELNNGANQVAFPTIHIAQGTFDLAAQYDVDPDLWLVDLHADSYPHGIYITKIYVDANVLDPTTELSANLNYCDAVANGAFPGANAALIKAISTTTGNFADAAVNTAIPTGKTIYITMTADPTDTLTQYHIRIHYYIPSS